jgi:hypothetical protein
MISLFEILFLSLKTIGRILWKRLHIYGLEVFNVVNDNFQKQGYHTDLSDLYDEAKELCANADQDKIELRISEVVERLNGYRNQAVLDGVVTAEIFGFVIREKSNKLCIDVTDKMGLKRQLRIIGYLMRL